MTQSAQSAGKAEELWEKHAQEYDAGCKTIDRDCFLAALSEYAKLYGEMVRKEDAEIAVRWSAGADAAISNKELPDLP